MIRATIPVPVDTPDAPRAVPAATNISRFFGLAAESTKARPADLIALKSSIEAIHVGSAPTSPAFGRLRHCATPNSSSRIPRTRLIHDAAVDGPVELPRSAAPEIAQNTAVTTTMPRIQPMRNPTLFARARLDSKMRITAMIGMGEIATPIADGRSSPITAPTGTHRPVRAQYTRSRRP